MKSLRLTEADYAAFIERKRKLPACKKCGKPCQLYGGVAGYSVHCKACNEKHATFLRGNRAKLKEERGFSQLPRKESQLEIRFLQQLEQAGLTECCIREYYAINGRDFRLDFAWPSRKLYVEVQGMAHRIKGRFRADIERRALLTLAGWRGLEIGGAEIKSGVAIQWLKELLAPKHNKVAA